jgi:hypothetical protein
LSVACAFGVDLESGRLMGRPRILVYEYAIYRVHEDWSEERQACCPQWMTRVGYHATTGWEEDALCRYRWRDRASAYIAKWRWLARDSSGGWLLVVVRIPTRPRLDDPICRCPCFPRVCRCHRP